VGHSPDTVNGAVPTSPSRVRDDCVVELVGLEPTTKVLWNIVVSDQLPWSDTYPDRGAFLLFGLIFLAF